MDRMIANRYQLRSSIGEGGMADVYLAMDTILKREVAIKILRGELSKDPITLLRFQREASAVSKLNHPNVVDVYDVGEYEGRHYIVMEYIRGRTLKQLISQRGALDQHEAVNIMIQLTSAVVHAHERNIIHRDIKPQNVLVKDDGTVKITDFGIALAHDSVQLTQSDAVLGSAHYLAPETTRGETPTNQVDIYALGIVFYELLSGTVPFRGDNPVQIAMKHLREDIPGVCDFNPTIWQSVENIIIHSTVKNRSRRYQSTEEMLYDLNHCLTPEYANVQKLVFADEEEPTRVMHSQDKGKARNKQKPNRRGEGTIIEEAVKEEKKNNHKMMIIVGIVAVLAIASTLTIMTLSGMFSGEKMLVVPEVVNSTQDKAITTLVDTGFLKENIVVKEELSDDMEKGTVMKLEPTAGQEISNKSTFTLTVSKGTYFVVEDYTNMNYDEVKAMLEKQNPNLKLTMVKTQSASMAPGYIIEQSGLLVGEKIDPDKAIELTVKVTANVEFEIAGLVGQSLDNAKSILKSKGINYPVLKQLVPDEDNEDNIQKGVVVNVDPAEGTWYVQSGNATITLYYY